MSFTLFLLKSVFIKGIIKLFIAEYDTSVTNEASTVPMITEYNLFSETNNFKSSAKLIYIILEKNKNYTILMSKISDLILKSFEYYDNQNKLHEKYLKKKGILDGENSVIIFDNVKFKYELLGVFDNQTNVWIWSWMIPLIDNEKSTISKKLLNYGLNIFPSNENQEEIYLKTQLLNSRFLIQDEFQLEIHLALASYLSRENFKFLYPIKKYMNKKKDKYITKYFLIL